MTPKSQRFSTSDWDSVVQAFPEANLLQSPEYAKMNQILDHKTIIEDFDGQGYALMIVRDARRGRYLEIPCGPLTDWSKTEVAQEIFAKIRQIAKRENCVFVRVRPQLLQNPENLQILERLGLKKSPMHLAAEHTIMIDLTQTTDEMLAKMRRQTRYEVRKATRQGITVEKRQDEAIFHEFYQVQAETAKRQNFIPPDLKTLLAEREAYGKNITIYIAKTGGAPESDKSKSDKAQSGKSVISSQNATPDKPESTKSPLEPGQPIAYGMIIHSGEEGDYYEAASTPLNRKLPGAYALLWQAMQDLKDQGLKRFNLWGIAPPDQPNHRYAGVTTFKTGFGGDIVTYVPAHDLVINPVKYAKDWVIETARRKRRHL